MSTNGNGTRAPSEIQAEIDRTRREMDGTLSAIEHRLTPGQLFDQCMSYLKDNGGTEFVSNLGNQAKKNPMPVALVGVGLAWLMAADKNSGTEPEYAVGDRLSQAKAGLADTANAMRDRAASVRDTTREQIERAKSGVDTMMREQPLALGAIGLAIGALAAALAPRTQVEDRTLGPVRDDLAEKAAERARPGENEFPDPTQEARRREREATQQGVRPYAERDSAEPPL
jgi:ElaB/YqjD/DUF883 family membrane-anchored ribosome-binding protein